jgi:2-polyprenyl-6-methoxyphenol hydroxylase-like FAD-dependent oxidoreductase
MRPSASRNLQPATKNIILPFKTQLCQKPYIPPFPPSSRSRHFIPLSPKSNLIYPNKLTMTKPIKEIVIIGGGMCGLASAIAIAQAFSSHRYQPSITVHEIRDTPSTFGGPVNLTPKALRCLDRLGVLEEVKRLRLGCEVDAIQIFSMRTGGQIAEIDYSGTDGTGLGGYKGWRVMRFELLKAMLRVAEQLPAVQILYGKKMTKIEEGDDQVCVYFEDGRNYTADLVLGCDGIHSATRRMLVEADRKPVYSGWAAAYGFVEAKELFAEAEKPFFEDTALVMSRYGSALTTFCDDSRSLIYTVLLMEMEEQGSREGWKSIGKDQERVRLEGVRRSQDSRIPKIGQIIEKVKDWTLYPIYVLPPNGRWHTDRVLLLGDAAHAVSCFLFPLYHLKSMLIHAYLTDATKR